MPRIQFLRRCVVETMPLPHEVQRARAAERERSELNVPVAVPLSLLRTQVCRYRAPAWYGFDRGAAARVLRCHERGRWWVLDLEDDVQARVPLPHVARLPESAPGGPEDPAHELPDAPFSAKVADPDLFFRSPDERGFWKAIVREPMEDTNRLVYADWLEDRGDPDAWIFRERLPFDTGGFQGLKWDEAAALLPQPNMGWASLTIQDVCGQCRDQRYPRHVRYHFADGSHPPQFVAYLLAVIRLRMWVTGGR
jgi:uncharacterized protein (TIGR02996 family)